MRKELIPRASLSKPPRPPTKEPPSRFPKRAPIKRAALSRAPFPLPPPPGSPVKELPLPDPVHGASSRRETPHPQSPLYHLSKSPADVPPSRFPAVRRGPLRREMLVSRAFFYMSYRDPSRGDLPPGSLNRAPTERGPPPPEPPSTISQSPR